MHGMDTASEGTETGMITRWFWGPFARLGYTCALATLVLDQACKAWMLLVYRIQDVKGRIAVTPFLDLVFVKNTGISYGMFSSGGPAGQILLSAFALLVAVGLSIWLAREANNRVVAASLGLIIGGAVGNAIDRILIGGVADFFLLHAGGFEWYVFNIADMAIVVGVIGLLYDWLRSSRGTASKQP